MIRGDDSLAERLRSDLSSQIETEKQMLVGSPTERRAGRIEAMQDILHVINGTVASLNDIRPKPEENRGNR